MASIKIIIILKNDSLGTDRGRGLRELVAILRDLFGQHDRITKHASSILLGVTNVKPKYVDDDDEIVETSLEDIQEIIRDTTGMDAQSEEIIQIFF